MISIKNLKTLEDLKEEHRNLNNQLKHLKANKSEQLFENTISLLRNIQAFLVQFELNVREHNGNFDKGFIANYKNGYLRGEVKIDSNRLQIIFDGEVIETIEVLPRPVHTTYMGYSLEVEEDILSQEILDIDAEIKELKDEIKAYEKSDIVYVVKGENAGTTLLNIEDVIKYLFK